MKKFFRISILPVIIMSFFFLAGTNNNIENPAVNTDRTYLKAGILTIDRIISLRKTSESFHDVRVFKTTPGSNYKKDVMDFSGNVTFLKLDINKLKNLKEEKYKNINFEIPLGQEKIILELTQVKILSDDFNVKTFSNSGVSDYNYEPGLYYQGIIKENNNSIAALSVFDDFLMVVISDEKGNYNLGSVKDNKGNLTEDYVYYNETDMSVKSKFNCGVSDDDRFFKINKNIENYEPAFFAGRLPVKIYFEADYQMYTDFGGNQQNVVNFVTGVFNSVALLYSREYLPVQISQVSVWTSLDPYSYYSNSYTILTKFGGRTQNSFNGNLAHLLSTGHQQTLGGIAWIRVLCGSYNPSDSSGTYAFSNIEPYYNQYPTYSWTVNVITHETGHNFGSRHTHACVWPLGGWFGYGAIDSCYYAEGYCFDEPKASWGTIMSYCHLWANQGGGIILSKGFGILPGDTIRYCYNIAPCFGPVINSSEQPVVFVLGQNFPNPFNPGTNIKFSIPENSFVSVKIYDITGRLITNLINDELYNPGIYTSYFNADKYNLASGIYLYRIIAKDMSGSKEIFSEVKKMILIR
ncbi:MAG: T9SS type A sorting domain-containing protein [Ignavibacteria bacterium]|nr:T9SS type A sorting domain-containing protein [Ignavibacteria bacterium]